MRGEDLSKLFLSLFKIETPPRAWGRLPDVNKAALLARNTPTCVGKTKPLTNTGATIKKHPHVRGEDHRDSAGRVRGAETPPRAWGRHFIGIYECRQGRNTPTCVGKTSDIGTANSLNKKHPHVRGEDSSTRILKSHKPETPPRAWGRPPALRRNRKHIGNTPTCVGKTATRFV